jgi:hypothetical protein
MKDVFAQALDGIARARRIVPREDRKILRSPPRRVLRFAKFALKRALGHAACARADWARTEVLPIALALPWGLTSGFVPYLPLPAQTTLAFLPPMTWPELGPGSADRPEDLERCYREVEAAMQVTMDRLTRGRRFLRRQPQAVAPRAGRHGSSTAVGRHAGDAVDAHRV